MIKYTSSLVLILLFLADCCAQEAPYDRKIIVGGSGSYSSYVIENPNDNVIPPPLTADFSIQENVKEYTSNNLNASLYFGLQLSANAVAGIIGNYSSSSSMNTPQELQTIYYVDSKRSTFGAGIFYRRYFKFDNSFRFFVQPNISVSQQHQSLFFDSSLINEYISQTSSLNLLLNYGFQYSINQKWNVLFTLSSLNFQKYKTAFDGMPTTTNGSDLDLSFNLQDIRIGMEYIF